MSSTTAPPTAPSGPVLVDAFGFKLPVHSSESRQVWARASVLLSTTGWETLPSAAVAISQVLESGLPLHARGNIWKAWVGADDIISDADYAQLLHAAEAKPDDAVSRQVHLDLHRTFPEHRLFTILPEHRAAESPTVLGKPGTGQVPDVLRRVLCASCTTLTGCAYVQGMSFVAAWALIQAGLTRVQCWEPWHALAKHVAEGTADEEQLAAASQQLLDQLRTGMLAAEADAARLFIALVTRVLPGLYAPHMPVVKAAQHVLDSALNWACPELSAALSHAPCGLSLMIPKWLLCVFLNVCPAGTAAQLWDAMFMQSWLRREATPAQPNTCVGTLVHMAVAMAVLHRHELQSALDANDIALYMDSVQSLGRGMVDGSMPLRVAFHPAFMPEPVQVAMWWTEAYAEIGATPVPASAAETASEPRAHGQPAHRSAPHSMEPAVRSALASTVATATITAAHAMPASSFSTPTRAAAPAGSPSLDQLCSPCSRASQLSPPVPMDAITGLTFSDSPVLSIRMQPFSPLVQQVQAVGSPLVARPMLSSPLATPAKPASPLFPDSPTASPATEDGIAVQPAALLSPVARAALSKVLSPKPATPARLLRANQATAPARGTAAQPACSPAVHDPLLQVDGICDVKHVAKLLGLPQQLAARVWGVWQGGAACPVAAAYPCCIDKSLGMPAACCSARCISKLWGAAAPSSLGAAVSALKARRLPARRDSEESENVGRSRAQSMPSISRAPKSAMLRRVATPILAKLKSAWADMPAPSPFGSSRANRGPCAEQSNSPGIMLSPMSRGRALTAPTQPAMP